jgi:hypothetical protein
VLREWQALYTGALPAVQALLVTTQVNRHAHSHCPHSSTQLHCFLSKHSWCCGAACLKLSHLSPMSQIVRACYIERETTSSVEEQAHAGLNGWKYSLASVIRYRRSSRGHEGHSHHKNTQDMVSLRDRAMCLSRCGCLHVNSVASLT